MTPAPQILMTVDAVGGVWTYALDLAGALAREGVETHLAVLGPHPSDAQRAAAAATPGVSVIETGLPLDWTAREPAEVLETAAAIRGLARGLKVDLVHLNTPALAALSGFSAPVVGACHSCLGTWWSAVRGGPAPADFLWRTKMLWQGLIACRALIAPSAAFALETARHYDVPRPLVVHNGRKPAPRPQGERMRQVITAGRLWDEGKNIAVLDKAAAQVKGPVYAAGAQTSPLGQRIKLDHAIALGNLTAGELASAMAASRVFATTALYEPFGLGVLEAAQAGCALVVSDIPTFRELWEGAAVFVDPHDPSAVAMAVNALLEDADTAQRVAAASQKRAERYTPRAMAAGTLEVYRTLAPSAFCGIGRERAA